MMYTIPKKLREETKLFSFGHGSLSVYLKDVAVLGVWAGLALALKGYVHTWLMVPYGAFAAATGLYLILPARRSNPGKRRWEALLLLFRRDAGAYYSLKGGKTDEP